MIAALLLAAAVAQGSGPEVIAVVDKIERNVMTEKLSNGDILAYTVVTMMIIDGGKLEQIHVYDQGPPFVGTRPLLTGMRVAFKRPPKTAGETYAMVDLKDFRLWGTPLNSPIPYDEAKRVFDDAHIASDEDNGKLWGQRLLGPLVFADPKTRIYVDEYGRGGELPKNVVVANTATMIDNVLTTMVSWPALRGSSVGRRRLLMHECFHRIQGDLGFPATNTSNDHLDTVAARVWLQLELRALAAALRASDEARTKAIGDAVAFRAARRAEFAGSAEKERGLENNEGLAEYTGWALRGTSAEESRQAFARHLDNLDPATSFVRGFAYETGPAYGLLLDAIKPGWTRNYKVANDLADVLAGGLKPAAPRPEVYGGAELRAAEERRDRENHERVARYRATLVDGPVLELPMKDANYAFDPNGVTALGDAGNAYQTLEVTAAWGRISVDGGARITGDWSAIFVPAADRAKLELKPGWKVVAGKRTGDFRVVQE